MAVVVAAATLMVACGSSDRSPGGAGDDEAELTVSAAASLTEAFTELGAAFEAEHPGATVTFTFDSSATLARQIRDGAPVDVFASADEEHVTELVDADLVDGEPTPFARNRLVIVTPPDNPERITALADLADAGVVSLCAEDAPCGTFAARALAAAEVTIPEGSVTRGQNAKATLTAVSEGDAVAAVVYATDALAAGAAVETVDLPAPDVLATYPVAVLADAAAPDLARDFVAFVASDEGRAILAAHGFLPPP